VLSCLDAPGISQNRQRNPEAEKGVGHSEATENMHSDTGGIQESRKPPLPHSIEASAQCPDDGNNSPGGHGLPETGGEFRFTHHHLVQADDPIGEGRLVEMAGSIESGGDPVPAQAHFPWNLRVHGFPIVEGRGPEIHEKEWESQECDQKKRALPPTGGWDIACGIGQTFCHIPSLEGRHFMTDAGPVHGDSSHAHGRHESMCLCQ